MTMPWENNNNQSWDNSNQDSDNSWDENQNNDSGESLENLFGDGTSDHEDGENSTGAYSADERSGDAHQSEDSEASDESVKSQDEGHTLDDVEEELANVPKRSQSTPQFSEKDVYQIVNLTTIIGVLDETQSSWMDIVFGTSSNSDDIKRAIRIVSMDSAEINDKIKPVEALQSLYEVSQETDPSKIIDNLLASIKTVDDLSTNDKGSLVSLMRRMAKNHADDNDGKVVQVRVSRNSSSADIVDAMKKLLEENPAVSESLSSLAQFIDVIRTALK